jgi:multidrug resistance efflux pump
MQTKSRRAGQFVLPFIGVMMLVFALYHVVRGQQTLPEAQPPVQPPRAPYGQSVAGAGIVEAETENIAIGSALPGVVLEVFVPVDKVGQRVKAGDPLFRVDDRQLRAQLKMQKANLLAAEAQLDKLDMQPRPEELPPSEAKVRTAKANVALVQDQYDRASKLMPNRAVSEEDYHQRRLSFETARQQLSQVQAEYQLLKAGAWDKDKAIARAAVEQARSQVDMIQTEIDRALVCAPVDGDVLQVNVRPGEYVGAPPSQALVVLGNLQKLHVRVDIDEHDIPRFRTGAPARAAVRGNPQVQFPLTFVRVEPYVIPKKSLTGDNTERVDTRVLQVIYCVDRTSASATPPELYVGMQVDVFLDTAANETSSKPAVLVSR